MLHTIAPTAFEDLADGALALLVAGQRLALKVEAVSRLIPVSTRSEPFSVLLRGPQTPTLPQGIYSLEHAQLGELSLFIVPVARDASGTQYEITFN